MRIAFFSPVSPQKTGIADYSEQEILPYLSKYFDIDVYIDRGVKPANPDLFNNFDCYRYDLYRKNAHNYDIPLYQMGNNGYHKFIYDTLLQYPGITVLHDIYLHGFFWGQSLAKGDSRRYIEEFKYCYGNRGEKMASEAILYSVYPEFTAPLIKRIIDRSVGIICHSEFGMARVLAEQPDAICTVISQPFTIKDTYGEITQPLKEQVSMIPGLEKKYPIITSFGYISAHKRYDVILYTFRKFLGIYPDAMLIIIGKDNIGLSRKIRDSGLEKQVIITGYVSEDTFTRLLRNSDFCINLRYPTAGETSRSVLQIMSLAKPVIVSNTGWFSELPSDTCLKVDVDSYEYEMLYEFFTLLTERKEIATFLGKDAREYISNRHDPKVVAKKYSQYIKNILNGNEILINSLSRSVVDMGLHEDAVELFHNRIDEIFCGIQD